MEPKVIIYIGHFKTGSSSLQRFLAANWRTLLYQGVLYPSTESEGAARNLRLLRNGVDEPVLGVSLNCLEPHNGMALRLKNEEDGHLMPDYYSDAPPAKVMMDNMMRQVDALEPRQVVLASEVFSVLASTAEHKSLERLAWRLSKYDVTIICNLRRPDLHIASWDMQRMRIATNQPPIHNLRGEGLNYYLDSIHLDYMRILSAWKKHFPNAKFEISNLSDVRKSGGSVAQLVRILNLPNPGGVIETPDFNASIPRAFSMAGRNALASLPPENSRKLIRALTRVPTELPRIADSEIELFGHPSREALFQRFLPVHKQLGELTGRQPFFDDIEQMREVGKVSDVVAGRESWPQLRDWLPTTLIDEVVLDWARRYEP